MKLKSLLASIAAAAFAAGSSQAALIAYWHFNDLDLTGGAPSSISADSGVGTISLANWGGTIDNFAGSTINRLGTDLAGVSLSLVNSSGNGSFIAIDFSTMGLTDVVLTFATRGTSTGFDSGLWSYSTNGIDFTPSGVGNTARTASTFALATVDLSSVTAINNQASVTLRYTLDGATSGSGNNRIDNLQINAIPEPSISLFSALGGLALLRRRR